jgi:hypothetical protein
MFTNSCSPGQPFALNAPVLRAARLRRGLLGLPCRPQLELARITLGHCVATHELFASWPVPWCLASTRLGWSTLPSRWRQQLAPRCTAVCADRNLSHACALWRPLPSRGPLGAAPALSPDSAVSCGTGVSSINPGNSTNWQTGSARHPGGPMRARASICASFSPSLAGGRDTKLQCRADN